MDVQTFEVLSKYNSSASGKMDEIIKGLTEQQWNTKFGGYFSSIKSLCNHIYICDFNWLRRFSGLREFSFIKDPIFKENVTFGTLAFDGIDDYLKKRNEMDKQIDLFVKELRDADFDTILEYKDSHGTI